MVASEVATAICIVIAGSTPFRFKTVNSIGTTMIPPPTPSRPASSPANAPASSRLSRSGRSMSNGGPNGDDRRGQPRAAARA